MFPELTRDDIFRLETQQLWLRWPRAADAESIARHAGDPEVALQTGAVPYPYAKADAERFILAARDGNTKGDNLSLALTLKRQPHDVIGMIAAHGAPGRGATEIGFWLGKPFWGHGLMGEAGAAFVDLLFALTAVQEIFASALPTNIASVQLLEKLGFCDAGTAVAHAPARGGLLTVRRLRLPRGANRTAFAARRPRLTSA